MLNKIIEFSIKNKLIIGLLVISLSVWGIYSIKQLPIDAVPDITNNQVQIITSSPSNGAEDIERFVTFPVEQSMATIPGIEEVRSFSRFGLSVVTVVFRDEIDLYWARQQVTERLTQASKTIPKGMGTPEIGPVTTGLGEIYQYVIHAKKGYEKKYNATELRTIQDWIVRRQLLGVEGVADVSSFGGYVKQYEITVKPEQINALNISISDIYAALEKNNQNTGGAYIDKKPNAYFIRSEGLIQSIQDIENIVVKVTENNFPILIKNVATVHFGSATRYGAMTRNNDGEVVGAIVMMLKGENSSKVIKNVKDRMSQIEKNLPKGIIVEPFLDRTKLVNSAIGTVTKNLAEGALIVIFVLVLFLGNFRAGLIVASVIPLAMLFAISLMNLFGVSGNLMSLGAIDFGLIVDGAVIIVEATLHHLNLKSDRGKLTQIQMDGEVFHSASKIRSSAAFGEIIILIVYLPILALVGVEGKMFKPMAQTVTFAILGAFILSLTYIPMMSALALSKKVKTKKNISDKLIEKSQKVYAPVLNKALKAKKLFVFGTIILFIASLFLFSTMGSEFIPTLEEGDFAVETRVMTGSSLSQTIDAASKSAKVLKDHFQEVKQVVGKIGSSEIPTDPMPVEACDLMVILKDKDEWTNAESRDELAEKMQKKLEQHIPGVTFGFQQPIQMRFNELMTGARQDVVVKVYGEDLDKLSSYATQIGNIARKIDGAQDIYVEEVSGLPQIVIHYKRDKIALFGLNIEDINTTIRTGFAGEVAGLIFEGEKRFDLVLKLDEENRQSLEDIRGLYIETSQGKSIPISQVADVNFEIGPNQIQRDDAKRRIIVGFNVRGRDVESIVHEIQRKIDQKVKFEAGYYPTYGGTFENLEAAKERLSLAIPVALLLIFFLLFITFKSIKQAFLIYTAIPLSAIGGILALWLRDMPFSISAGVGFIALFGVAVLNGIVLIAEFNRLKKEGYTDVTEIIKIGTKVRLRPVLMTALVASLGFLPMALSNGSGAEVQKPLATVVFGGLISATLLTLIILPIFYYWSEKFKPTSMQLKKSIGVIVCCLFSSAIFGQIQEISLKQALEIGAKSNKNIYNSNFEIQQMTQYKKSLIDIPKTNVSLLMGQYNSVSRNDKNISISQTLPFPTVFKANSNLGSSLIAESKLKLEMTKSEIAYQIKENYYSLQYLYDYKRLLESQDSNFQQILKLTNRKFDAGDASLIEKMTAETQASYQKNKLNAVSSQVLSTTMKLNYLLGNEQYYLISEKSLTAENLLFTLDTALLKNNASLHYLSQLIQTEEHHKKVQLAQAFPDITLGYFNQSLIGTQTINGQNVTFTPSNRFQGFQIGLALPLYYMTPKSKIKAADLNKKVVENNYQLQKQQLESELNQAYLDYQRLKQSFIYYQESVLGNVEKLSQLSSLAYEKGEIDQETVLKKLNEAKTLKEEYLKTLLEYNISIAKIELLINKN